VLIPACWKSRTIETRTRNAHTVLSPILETGLAAEGGAGGGEKAPAHGDAHGRSLPGRLAGDGTIPNPDGRE
jgi:hypothetical protein